MKNRKRSANATSQNGLNEVYARLVRQVEKMSTRKRFAYMVSAGIYTRKGKLTERYGG